MWGRKLFGTVARIQRRGRTYASITSSPPDRPGYATATTHHVKIDVPVPSIDQIPLDESIPGLPEVSYVRRNMIEAFASQVTTLNNGLRVASEPNYGEYCTIGVAIDAGARYEIQYPAGTSHFLEKLAFASSSRHRDKEEMLNLLESRGAIVDCQSTRDTFIYASSCHVDGMEDILSLIADAVFRPNITSDELDAARSTILFENEHMNRMAEWNTLGHSKFCPTKNVNKITREHLFTFLKQHFDPKRMVIAGVNVDHGKLVDAVGRHFNEETATWNMDKSVLLEKIPELDRSIAQYTGGDVRVVKDLSNLSMGPSPFPNLAHFILGFDSCGYKDEDFVPFCVLQSLMGGGGSFSAGGPGKGMYTRLYVDVLNKHHWMYNATSYHHAYADAGLFCIHASSDPTKIDTVVEVLVDQVLHLTEGVEKEELNRAKTQLTSQLMMNLEVRPVMFEDLARQVIGHGYRRKPMEYAEKIRAVTEGDIRRVTERMLASSAATVGYGDIGKMPSYEKIDKAIAKRSVKELRRR